MSPGSLAPISRILSCPASRGGRARQSCILSARRRAPLCDSSPDYSGNTVLHTGTHLAVSPLPLPEELTPPSFGERGASPLSRLGVSVRSTHSPTRFRECAGVTRCPFQPQFWDTPYRFETLRVCTMRHITTCYVPTLGLDVCSDFPHLCSQRTHARLPGAFNSIPQTCSSANKTPGREAGCFVGNEGF